MSPRVETDAEARERLAREIEQVGHPIPADLGAALAEIDHEVRRAASIIAEMLPARFDPSQAGAPTGRKRARPTSSGRRPSARRSIRLHDERSLWDEAVRADPSVVRR